MLTCWYARRQQSLRIGIFFSGATLAGAFGGKFFSSNLNRTCGSPKQVHYKAPEKCTLIKSLYLWLFSCERYLSQISVSDIFVVATALPLSYCHYHFLDSPNSRMLITSRCVGVWPQTHPVPLLAVLWRSTEAETSPNAWWMAMVSLLSIRLQASSLNDKSSFLCLERDVCLLRPPQGTVLDNFADAPAGSLSLRVSSLSSLPFPVGGYLSTFQLTTTKS